jgi:cyclic nucleotide-binding protein
VRIESSVTSISWIPRGAIEGVHRLPFEAHRGRYDQPPPDHIDDLDALAAAGAFRFANRLVAWIETDRDRVVAHGQDGGGLVGAEAAAAQGQTLIFPQTSFPDLRPAPQAGQGSVRFTQTAGGRTGVGLPHRAGRGSFDQLAGPPSWTTLALTIHADGRAEHELAGASPFPRHWLYDHDGRLVAETGVIDFTTWYREHYGRHNPWGGEEAQPVVTAVESALERTLEAAFIGSDPAYLRLRRGQTLCEQGDPGGELFLLFDGVLRVEIDGEAVAEVGPGAILGEMAVLADGLRTATLRAVTPCRVVAVPGDRVDRAALAEVARQRRGDEPQGS